MLVLNAAVGLQYESMVAPATGRVVSSPRYTGVILLLPGKCLS